MPDSTVLGSTAKELNGESYNDIVQVVIQQVWQSFFHDFLLWHSLEAVNFPLHLLEALINLLLLAVCLSLGGLLGLRTRFGSRCIWVLRRLRRLWCLRNFWRFGWFGLLGLCLSASLFGWGYKKGSERRYQKQCLRSICTLLKCWQTPSISYCALILLHLIKLCLDA